MVERAKVSLFTALGVVYVLAVLALEFVIMPRYVYTPIRTMLAADEASRSGERGQELIPEHVIPGDEIGHIMRSRNETVAELRRQEERLEAQDRLASLGMLSASVAHEMNTPLAVLHGSIEKLLETADDEQTIERLQRMLRVTERLRTISEGLLGFSRVRRQHMAPVALRQLIDDAWGLVGIDARARSVAFSAVIPEEAWVIGNADRLVQVFVNVLRNAVMAVNGSGKIVARAQRDGSRWTVAVEDNGPGIPEDVLPDIFNAFVSSRLDAEGTGLGLTVAQGIVDQHGGTIAASNCRGGGARLDISLPAAG